MSIKIGNVVIVTSECDLHEYIGKEGVVSDIDNYHDEICYRVNFIDLESLYFYYYELLVIDK